MAEHPVAPSGQFSELFDKCNYKFATQNNVQGVLITGKNGSTLFLPIHGFNIRAVTTE